VNFRDRFKWQMQFVPLVCSIVGPLLIEPAPFELDACEATDLLVLKARDMRIACRIRSPGYLEEHGWEFTLRSRLDTGTVTEMDKVLLHGYADAMFYAHASLPVVGPFSRWLFINLAHFRGHMTSRERRAAIRHGECSNGDGTHFCWFDVRSFLPDPPLLIAQSHQWHDETQQPQQQPGTRIAAKPAGNIGPLFDRR
jgi:hypothetical protein